MLRATGFRNRGIGNRSLRPERLALPHVPRTLVRGGHGVVGELLFLASDEGNRPADRDRLGELTRIHLGVDRPERRQPHIGPDHGIAVATQDRKSTRLNSSHSSISYAVFCLKKK